ncbi:MAG: cytochrome c [Thermostichus sp. DG_1_6_bins_120]
MLHSLSDIAESHSSLSSADSSVGFGQERVLSQRQDTGSLSPALRVRSFFSTWGRRLSLGLIALLLVFFWIWWGGAAKVDPYTEAVLSLSGEASHGASLFALNCAACHGEEADGRVGPSLRGVSSRRSERFIIRQVTSGSTPPMPQFQPDPQEMADLLSYLKSL